MVNSPQELQEVLAFEQKRLQDSLDRVKKWTAEREARQWAREERERAYQQQRAIWDAEKAARAEKRAANQARYDSLMRSRPQKLTKGMRLDANTADTTQWQRVPGIGTAYAQAIVRYRQRLGGLCFIHSTPRHCSTPPRHRSLRHCHSTRCSAPHSPSIVPLSKNSSTTLISPTIR